MTFHTKLDQLEQSINYIIITLYMYPFLLRI